MGPYLQGQKLKVHTAPCAAAKPLSQHDSHWRPGPESSQPRPQPAPTAGRGGRRPEAQVHRSGTGLPAGAEPGCWAGAGHGCVIVMAQSPVWREDKFWSQTGVTVTLGTWSVPLSCPHDLGDVVRFMLWVVYYTQNCGPPGLDVWGVGTGLRAAEPRRTVGPPGDQLQQEGQKGQCRPGLCAPTSPPPSSGPSRPSFRETRRKGRGGERRRGLGSAIGQVLLSACWGPGIAGPLPSPRHTQLGRPRWRRCGPLGGSLACSPQAAGSPLGWVHLRPHHPPSLSLSPHALRSPPRRLPGRPAMETPGPAGLPASAQVVWGLIPPDLKHKWLKHTHAHKGKRTVLVTWENGPVGPP